MLSSRDVGQPRPGSFRRMVVVRDKFAIALLTTLWLGMIVLVNPVGDFPLNDDWAYGWSVKVLLEHGDFQLSDWTAVNLLSQVGWGALFCLPFGFSFTALRLSTLCLGLIGVLATYGVLREVRATPGVALAGALTVALNPLYFGLSNSFMSDVPSFSFTTVAFYLLIRALNRQSTEFLVLGVLASVIAILNRQASVIIVPAFAAGYLMTNGLRRWSVAGAFLISLPGLAAYLIYPRWLEASGRTPHLYDYQTRLLSSSLTSSGPEIVAVYAQNVLPMALYLGLFLLPFMLLARSDFLRPQKLYRPRTLGVFSLSLAIGLWAAMYTCLPSVPNVLNVLGVGPSSIAGTTGLDIDPLVLRRIWQVVTVAAAGGAGVLLLVLFDALGAMSRHTKPAVRGLYAFALGMVVLFVLPIAALPRGYWFDRYLIALLPPLMVLSTIGKEVNSNRRPIKWGVFAAVTLAIYGLFTVAATHDYLSWNRHRWMVLNTLMRERQIPPEKVHGGSEFSGWFFGQEIETCNGEYRENAGSPAWSDFTCLSTRPNIKYRVATGPRRAYITAARYSFSRWLPPTNQTFYLLRHESLTE